VYFDKHQDTEEHDTFRHYFLFCTGNFRI